MGDLEKDNYERAEKRVEVTKRTPASVEGNRKGNNEKEKFETGG